MVVSADPVDLLMRLSGAQCVSRALHVVAELGIADALDDTPQSTFLEKRGRIDEHTFSENDMSIRATDLYEFGPYRLNPERRLFTRGQFVVPLAPKTFELLLLMVQHPGRAFSKQELMTAPWPDTFVERPVSRSRSRCCARRSGRTVRAGSRLCRGTVTGSTRT